MHLHNRMDVAFLDPTRFFREPQEGAQHPQAAAKCGTQTPAAAGAALHRAARFNGEPGLQGDCISFTSLLTCLAFSISCSAVKGKAAPGAGVPGSTAGCTGGGTLAAAAAGACADGRGKRSDVAMNFAMRLRW